MPNNHDVNPYGIAFVPAGLPAGSALQAGDVVVSNFNAASNKQGTGTTIVKLVTDGKPVTFFQGQNLGLTTALAVLKSGYVLVGNLPTTNGATITSTGSLLVITPQGKLLSELKDPTLLDGPWDMTVIIDNGQQVTAFVSNVLNGTVARIDLNIGPNGATLLQSSHLIASGYAHRPDPAALVVGPTGLAYDAAHDVLYVASTNDNKVFAIAGAAALAHDNGPGSVIYQDSNHLRGPLALALAPNGDLVTANGDAINPDPNQSSEIVEFTPDGRFVAQMQVDPAPGSAFGLAFGLSSSGQPQFAAVNDSTNTAIVWTLRPVGGN
ncbi:MULTISPECIES: hypothetical protein [Ralstonia solanacearum species complex]|uniref:Uncharacterized protein n=2 Tax=Ralstonia solanacearum species complex TaxID=3116862 RepID=A0A454TSZ4_9RALS|nr:hypothetical protein [Ralstonia pseudosolanacearum]OIT13052.1 hypothetical protein BL241_04945 [Ralstonia solanacearum]AST85733.1 hypothetical protein CIG66_04330 [Ralstonia pseudosolanacearum]AYA45795.1 hypothetical protein RSP824_04450 [Ralstonia pseudosolanacearum]MCK4118903.1 hypothetical protein [Ralstonia pseudosolanacearum]MCK4127720.1 hypothetical protein [Ralstonia pseudosolanacearum]